MCAHHHMAVSKGGGHMGEGGLSCDRGHMGGRGVVHGLSNDTSDVKG
jgi:hypothetical protein